MKIKAFAVVLFCLYWCAGQQASAQNRLSKVPSPQQKNFALFFEKIYVHTDRDYYATGDDLWFKAYLVNGLSNYPTYTSNNLYVELVSPEAKIMAREILRVDSGMATGDFKLTDSIPEGVYHLRSYTNWMRNFGDNFIFDKQITIHSVAGVKPQNPQVKTGKRGNKTTDVQPVNIAKTYRISFFPEGGSMIDGVASFVGFKAEDAMGHGVKVTGDVKSASGDMVGHFESTDLGLGSFSILPSAGTKYRVTGVYKNNQPFEAELPDVLSQGYAIHINNSDSGRVQAIISTNQATLGRDKGKSLTIIATHADKAQYEGKVALADLQMAVSIPKAKLSAGVNSIVLYDADMHPNCERLVYINDKSGVKLVVTPDKTTYAPKEKTTVNIAATDAKNQPVKANLSVAVVDESITPADETNIAAYLMLQSEVRGKIENAAQYFDPRNVNRFKQIDLLLLTQGWRDFVWKRLKDSTLQLSYLPEAGFTVSGRVRALLANRPIVNTNITLYAPGAKGSKFFSAKTDQEGKYYFDGMDLYGNQTLKIKSSDEKGKKSGWLFLDSLGNNELPVLPAPIYNEEPSPQLAAFNQASTIRMNNINKFKGGNIRQLNEVNIIDKPKTVTLLDETLQTAGYPEYEFNITPADYKYKDLEDYLRHKIPGAQTDINDGGLFFYFVGKKVYIKFIVDKREDTYQRLDYYSLPMDQIITVSERHLMAMGGDDRILVYLTLKPGAFDKKDFSLINEDVTGYYSSRTFYAPNYEYGSTKPDQRITIHWEPMLSTDGDGKASVSFYNADPKSKVRIVVQGLTDKGVPVTSTVWYNIK